MKSAIELRLQAFLDLLNRESVDVSDELLDEFASHCREAMRRLLRESGSRKRFTLRMSNVGKPLCQLQMEALGVSSHPEPYNMPMKMLFGDLVEATVLTMLKASGVNVQSTNQHVTLNIADIEINGTYDVKIDDKIYDIKSASDYSFRKKFHSEGDGVSGLTENDPFGYVGQGFGYAEADGSKFGGWIAVNKETGEVAVLEIPDDYTYIHRHQEALNRIEETAKAITSKQPFKRLFTDEPEVYYKNKTGNRILPSVCAYCSFRRACWPDTQYRPTLASKGKNPKWVHYTYIDEENLVNVQTDPSVPDGQPPK